MIYLLVILWSIFISFIAGVMVTVETGHLHCLWIGPFLGIFFGIFISFGVFLCRLTFTQL